MFLAEKCLHSMYPWFSVNFARPPRATMVVAYGSKIWNGRPRSKRNGNQNASVSWRHRRLQRRSWCRWKGENEIFPTTPRSSQEMSMAPRYRRVLVSIPLGPLDPLGSVGGRSREGVGCPQARVGPAHHLPVRITVKASLLL